MLLQAARRLASSAAPTVSALQAGSSCRCAVAHIRFLPSGRCGCHKSCCCMSTFGSHMSENDPAALAHHKEKALKGETPTFVPNAEGWNETLASVSEAVVKAERNVADDAATAPEKLEVLQKQTVEVIQQLHHVGEDGASRPPKRPEMDMSGSPAHSVNLEHTKNSSPGMDPR